MIKSTTKKELQEETHSMTNAADEHVTQPQMKETAAQRTERLEQEVADLRKIVDSQPRISEMDAKYMQDLAFFDKQKTGANTVVTKDITDHKNISLWTAWGKRIGPMYPKNALYTYHKFRRLGRILYTSKPTEDQIQAYYKSPEYIAWKKKFDIEREKRNKSKRKGELEKILGAMVSITGQTREQLQAIIDKPVGIAGA